MRTAAIMCAIVVAASAADAQGLGYGVKAGVNLSDLKSTDSGADTPFTMRSGLVAGAFLTWPIAGRLELQPEALFSRKGAALEQGGGTSAQVLDYLEVPVLASYRVFGAPGRHVSLLVGPAISLRLRAKSRASFGSDTLERDISDEVERTDLAVIGGAAYHRGRLVLEGRYSWGLSDVDATADDEVTVKNRGLSILAGWRF